MAKQQNWQRDRVSWAGIVGVMLLAFYPIATPAQIAGDGTLGTQVNGAAIAPCTGTCIITDGTTRGNNLFHSFRQFSLPNGDVAGFITTPAIQTVIVRVTGVGQPFISNINGTIATSNPANFFLLNPNGIIFGAGATLNIGGSFLATTANRMQFADGTELRTDTPASLLTISVPIGLQFGQTPGNIQMQRTVLSSGNTDSFSDFALVGGDVSLSRSGIQAPGRRVALAGVGDNGTVELQVNGDRLNLSLPVNTPRRDITLTNGSFMDASASTGGGDVIVVGHNTVLSRSFIFAGILAGSDNILTNQAGDITIEASANLQLTQGSQILNTVDPDATGQGGNTRITASDIRLRDGSVIGTSTSGTGNAGNVQVDANTIALDQSRILSGVDIIGSGRGGDITIQVGSLAVTNGAVISASTFGTGNGGNVRVTANTITLDGTTPDGRFISGIVSQVAKESESSSGGNITIETGSLTVTNGATVSTSIRGNGNGGNVRVTANRITLDGTTPDGQFISGIGSQVAPGASGRAGSIIVTTDSLSVINGATVSASTGGNGNGGNVQVTANRITLDGTTPDGQFISGIGSQVGLGASGRGGDVTVETDSLAVFNGANVSAGTFGNGDAGNVRVLANTIGLDGTTPDRQFGSGISSQVGSTGSGGGGDVTVETGSLTITKGAGVSASNLSSGRAGDLDITAQTMQLDRGEITAQSVSGDGANITINVRDLLLLRNNSEISTSAGTAQAGGDGGNISIKTPFIVGVLKENSDITANAFTGRGGNINITTNAIYGLQFQPQLTRFSDITASSQFGVRGTVAIETLNIDPSRGLVELPVNLTDPSQQITQGCTPGSKTAVSSFVATGRGGIPLSPDEPLESRAIVTKWVPLPEESRAAMDEKIAEPDSQVVSARSRASATPIVEAQGWRVGADGVVELVARAATGDRPNFGAASVSCRVSQGN